MFKDLANIASLVKNAGQLQSKMAEMQQSLGHLVVEGQAGEGRVTITATGHQQIVNCQIDPLLLTSEDVNRLEEFIVTACNLALDKARNAAAEKLQGVAGGMPIPGLNEMLSKIGRT